VQPTVWYGNERPIVRCIYSTFIHQLHRARISDNIADAGGGGRRLERRERREGGGSVDGKQRSYTRSQRHAYMAVIQERAGGTTQATTDCQRPDETVRRGWLEQGSI